MGRLADLHRKYLTEIEIYQKEIGRLTEEVNQLTLEGEHAKTYMVSLSTALNKTVQENQRLQLIADVLDSHHVACRKEDCSVCYHYRKALEGEGESDALS